MNNKKGGNLKYVSLVSCIQSYNDLENMIKAMKVSDKDMEDWYGDKKVAKEMQGDQLEKAFHFGLVYLDVSNCALTNYAFKMKNLQKENDPKWPCFMHFLASPQLETVNMSNCKLTK